MSSLPPWSATGSDYLCCMGGYLLVTCYAMCPVLHVEGLRSLPGVCVVGHQRAGSSLCVHSAFHLCFLHLYLVPGCGGYAHSRRIFHKEVMVEDMEDNDSNSNLNIGIYGLFVLCRRRRTWRIMIPTGNSNQNIGFYRLFV